MLRKGPRSKTYAATTAGILCYTSRSRPWKILCWHRRIGEAALLRFITVVDGCAFRVR